VTGDDADRMRFKVPQLRNVAVTGPWFHDGSAARLEEAVRIMARIQLDEELPDKQVADIVACLGALTGKDREEPPGARLQSDESHEAGAAGRLLHQLERDMLPADRLRVPVSHDDANAMEIGLPSGKSR